MLQVLVLFLVQNSHDTDYLILLNTSFLNTQKVKKVEKDEKEDKAEKNHFTIVLEELRVQ